MGTSFVEYGEFGFWTRDKSLTSWLSDLLNEIDSLPDPEPWLDSLVEKWQIQIDIDGGCMDPNLDKFLNNNDRIKYLTSLSEKVLQNCSPDGFRTGQLFISLLKGNLKTTVSSPIDYL